MKHTVGLLFLLKSFISVSLLKKLSFPLRISSVNVTKSAADLATFNENILNGKLHFLSFVYILVFVKTFEFWWDFIWNIWDILNILMLQLSIKTIGKLLSSFVYRGAIFDRISSNFLLHFFVEATDYSIWIYFVWFCCFAFLLSPVFSVLWDFISSLKAQSFLFERYHDLANFQIWWFNFCNG